MIYPTTLKEAKVLQTKYYQTGKLCPHGHNSKRYTKSSRCVECVSEKQKTLGNKYAKKWRETHKETNKVKNKEEYRKQGKNYIYLMWSRAKKRALEKNIPFSIDLNDIIIPTVCPVLNVPFVINDSGRGPGDYSPSLDRIIPELGYVKNNIKVISFKANRIKSDADVVDLKKVLEYVEHNNSKYNNNIL